MGGDGRRPERRSVAGPGRSAAGGGARRRPPGHRSPFVRAGRHVPDAHRGRARTRRRLEPRWARRPRPLRQQLRQRGDPPRKRRRGVRSPAVPRHPRHLERAVRTLRCRAGGRSHAARFVAFRLGAPLGRRRHLRRSDHDVRIPGGLRRARGLQRGWAPRCGRWQLQPAPSAPLQRRGGARRGRRNIPAGHDAQHVFRVLLSNMRGFRRRRPRRHRDRELVPEADHGVLRQRGRHVRHAAGVGRPVSARPQGGRPRWGSPARCGRCRFGLERALLLPRSRRRHVRTAAQDRRAPRGARRAHRRREP